MRVIPRFMLTCAAVASTATLAACGDDGTSTSSSGGSPASTSEASTLVFADLAEPTTIDPAIANTNQDFTVTRNVYDHLTTYASDAPGEILPALATEWKQDGKSWTFTLREGVKFHDGSPFDSEDVKASIDRILEIGQGQGYLIDSVASTSAPDPQTLKIRTKQPDAFLAANLSHIEIVSADDIADQAQGDDLAQEWFKGNANGTGPYKFVSWEKGAQIELERNPDWWGEWAQNPPERVIDRFVTDGTTRAQGLEGGEFDLANFVPVDEARRIGAKEGFELVSGDNLFAWPAIYLNTAKAPTDDAKFREALVKAFDYDAMVEYNGGDAVIGRGPIPEWFPNSPENELPEISTDLAAAESALSAAGTSEREMLCAIPSNAPEFKFAATVLQSSAKKIGVRVKIQELPLTEALDKAKKKQSNCFVLGNAMLSPVDPTKFFDAHYVSGGFFNAANISDPELDSLVEKISTTGDEAARKELVAEASQKVVDTHAIIWAARPATLVPVPDHVKGYEIDPTEYINARFYELSLEG
jgi:peptide/nickel transport system substrate-binding protein